MVDVRYHTMLIGGYSACRRPTNNTTIAVLRVVPYDVVPKGWKWVSLGTLFRTLLGVEKGPFLTPFWDPHLDTLEDDTAINRY